MKAQNFPQNLLLLILILLTSAFLFSCKDEDSAIDILQENSNSANESFIISQNQALEVANAFYSHSFDKNYKSAKVKTERNVKSSLSVPGNNSQDAFFIVNYEEGGFAIVSADKRIQPILAYSNTNNFQIDSDFYPSGLVDWILQRKEEVDSVRFNKSKQIKAIKYEWDRFLENSDASNPSSSNSRLSSSGQCYYDGQTYSETTIKGPLTQTTWGQGVGYNDAVPHTGCSNYSNGRAPTGCVATAMAQIMRYYQAPSSYAWSGMPNGSGSTAIANLMVDIGNAVDMDWGCNGSSADTKNDAAPAFINDFNYSAASYASYSQITVTNEIDGNHPVILKGGRNNKWWIFNVYDDGHAWVCDGYRRTQYYECEQNPYTGEFFPTQTYSSLYLHMNWGWGNGLHNGYYAFDNWNPGSHTFNYKRGMVKGIRP